MSASPDSTPISNRAAKPVTSPTPSPVAALCATGWVQHGVTRAAFEPTGRYHRELHQCLFDSGLETVAVNPLRSRRFAEAIGRLAKNDRVDASMLARYGLLSGLAGTPPKAPILHRLNDLIAIRRKHVAQRAAQLKLHSQLDADTTAELGDPLVQLFDELISKADTALQACIASDPELARRAALAAAIIRATCSTWPPLPQSASIPRCKPSSSASAPAASSTRSPWSPSCAS